MKNWAVAVRGTRTRRQTGAERSQPGRNLPGRHQQGRDRKTGHQHEEVVEKPQVGGEGHHGEPGVDPDQSIGRSGGLGDGSLFNKVGVQFLPPRHYFLPINFNFDQTDDPLDCFPFFPGTIEGSLVLHRTDVDVGTVFHKGPGHVGASEKSCGVKRGVSLVVPDVGVGPLGKEEFGGPGLVGPDRDGQGRLPAVVPGVRTDSALEMEAEVLDVTAPDGSPEVGFSFCGRELLVAALGTGACEVSSQYRSGPGQGEEDHSADYEGQEDALDAMQEQFGEASPLPQHGGEVATDQEKEGHAEAVDGVISRLVEFVLLQVLDGPVGVLEKREKAVHHDAEEHGGGSQGIEVVVAGGAAHGGNPFPGWSRTTRMEW